MPPRRQWSKPKKGTIKRLMKSLWKYFKLEIIISLVALIFSIAVNLCGSVFASLITDVIEQGLTAKKTNANASIFVDWYRVKLLGYDFLSFDANLTSLIIALAIIYGVGVLCSWTWTRTMAIVTQKYLNMFRNKMFSHMQKLPIKYFDTHQNGAIMSLYTNDIDTIRQFVSQSLPNMFATGLTILGCLFVMFSFSLWMTFVVLVGTAAMAMNTKIIGGRASRYFVAQQKSVGKVEGNIEESITGLKVIKVFTHEEDSFNGFETLNKELCHNSTVANIHGNIMGPINGNIGNFIYVFIAILGCILFIIPGTYNLGLNGWHEIHPAPVEIDGVLVDNSAYIMSNLLV